MNELVEGALITRPVIFVLLVWAYKPSKRLLTEGLDEFVT